MYCNPRIFFLNGVITDSDQLPLSPLLPINGGDLPAGEYGFALTKLLISLIVVAGLLWLTMWFLRRLIRYKLEKGSGIQAIRILEKKMISPKTMLYFLEIEGERILLAESQLEVRQIKTQRTSDLENPNPEHLPQ